MYLSAASYPPSSSRLPSDPAWPDAFDTPPGDRSARPMRRAAYPFCGAPLVILLTATRRIGPVAPESPQGRHMCQKN